MEHIRHYPDNGRNKPDFEGKLTIQTAQPEGDNLYCAHLADLMAAIRNGQRPVITRSSTRHNIGNSIASIAWKTPLGQWNRFTIEGTRYKAEPPPPEGCITTIDGDSPWPTLVDKLLTAVSRNYHIVSRIAEGTAVLSWDRASHGNTPTITLDQEDNIHGYYNWPHRLPQHLEPSHTPAIFGPRTIHHYKPLRPEIVPHLHPEEHEPGYALHCKVNKCPGQRLAPAVDSRNWNHGYLCHYHLYGPAGYVNNAADSREFKRWLLQVNNHINSLTPMEQHAEAQRARVWSRPSPANPLLKHSP